MASEWEELLYWNNFAKNNYVHTQYTPLLRGIKLIFSRNITPKYSNKLKIDAQTSVQFHQNLLPIFRLKRPLQNLVPVNAINEFGKLNHIYFEGRETRVLVIICLKCILKHLYHKLDKRNAPKIHKTNCELV